MALLVVMMVLAENERDWWGERSWYAWPGADCNRMGVPDDHVVCLLHTWDKDR